jgi:hypothetical protein
MKNKLILLLTISIWIFISSCSKDDEEISPTLELSDYDLAVISYFKNIALGFEFGTASAITRKWSEMKVFVGGNVTNELIAELENIKTEINDLATDGFKIVIVNDSIQSNYYVFFGSGVNYADLFPSQSNLVNSNWGLFNFRWNGQNQLISGNMYVDIDRADLAEQKHLLREEFTQSLGLAKDSPFYMESIFQSAWTTTNEYAIIDRDLIRLLYHPEMSVGLNENQVDQVLKNILINE